MAEAAAAPPTQLAVLVLGGCGFVGRHLVKHIVDCRLASYVRVADKATPAVAYMSPEHAAAFEHPSVAFVQADLSKERFMAKVFAPPPLPSRGAFDFVFNLAAETKHGLSDAIYESRVAAVAAVCGSAAAAHGVLKFVEVSSAAVYRSQSGAPADEAAALEPWTRLAAWKLRAEDALRAVPALPLIVLRPALVYGVGDVGSLMPRAACAVAYARLGQTMQLLWGPGLRVHTVHVADLVAACWYAASSLQAGSLFNVADAGGTDAGRLNDLIGVLFGIKTGFHGVLISNLARMDFAGSVREANDAHLAGWMAALREAGITSTPISPVVDAELLTQTHLNVDGGALARTGFKYAHPQLTLEALRESVEAAVALRVFPPLEALRRPGGAAAAGK